MRFIFGFGLLAGFHQLAYSKPVNSFASPLIGESAKLRNDSFCAGVQGCESKTAIVPTAITTTNTVL